MTAANHVAETNAARLDAIELSVHTAIGQTAALEGRLASHIEALGSAITAQTAIVESVRASMAQTDDLVGRVVEAVEVKLATAQQNGEENSTRLDAFENSLHTALGQTTALETRLAAAIQKIERDIEIQTALVENVRTSMAQTDDLVGRVVEAVEGILVDLGSVRS
jgi:cell fate (sporulation/competence/biofilm development) regulator YmcA (YheA/YmcA/DUF963 family)